MFTSQFPYGMGETFLETEISFLSEVFDEVQIFATAVNTFEARFVPENVRFSVFSEELSRIEKLVALTAIFSKDYQEEKRKSKQAYGLKWTRKRRNTALVSLARARKITKMLGKFCGNNLNEQVVLYSYWCNDSAIGLGLFCRSHPSVEAVTRVHGWDLYFEATPFNYLPFRALIAEYLSLFPISSKGESYIKDRWKVDPVRIEIARLGTKNVQKIGGRSERNVLVSCSNLIPLKRVSLIAKALIFLKDIQLDWYHFGDGVERQVIENILKEIPSDHIQVHLMGRKKNVEILNWYSQNNPDLFVNVSTTEGIPVSIMEAMSFGIPVFATDVGGTSEIVNNENGQLLQVDISAKELSERIRAFFLSSNDFREAVSVKAFETWKSEYNAETNYTKFAQALIRMGK